MLHRALRRGHGGILRRAGDVVVPGVLGALVDEDKAHVGLVLTGGGNAGVEVDIVVQGNVVIAVSGGGDALLTQPGVDPAVDQCAVVVVLLDQQVCVIHAVDPVGHFLIIGTLAGDSIYQNCAVGIRAAEQADGLDQTGAHPPGRAVLVDLKIHVAEHHGGVLETQGAVEVASEVFSGGVFHALAELYQLGLLRHHVDHDVAGQTLGAVIEPLDDVAIHQRCDADGLSLIVDLGVFRIGHLELRHQIAVRADAAQRPSAELDAGVFVQHGDLIVRDFRHIGGKVAGLHVQQVIITLGMERGGGNDRTDGADSQHDNRENERYFARRFQHPGQITGVVPADANAQTEQ